MIEDGIVYVCESANGKVVRPVINLYDVKGSEIVQMRPLEGQNTGALKRITQYDKNGIKKNFLEFENGIETLLGTYNESGEMTNYIAFEHEYNSDGQVIKTTFKENGESDVYCIYEY